MHNYSNSFGNGRSSNSYVYPLILDISGRKVSEVIGFDSTLCSCKQGSLIVGERHSYKSLVHSELMSPLHPKMPLMSPVSDNGKPEICPVAPP